VRQLKNVARFLAVTCREKPLRWNAALDRMLEPRESEKIVLPVLEDRGRRKPSEVPIEELTATLIKHDWRIRPSATALGLSRASLYMLVDRFPHLREARDIPDERLQELWKQTGGDLARTSSGLGVSPEALQLRLNQKSFSVKDSE
jgi:DNA-binding NtrC family response regulator